MSKPKKVTIRTPKFRMSFANVVTPRAFEDPKTGSKGTPEFSTEMLLDEADLAKFAILLDDNSWKPIDIRKYYDALAGKAWPGFDLKAAEKFGAFTYPVRDGNRIMDERAKKGKNGDAYEGKFVIRAKSKQEYAPRLNVVTNGRRVELTRTGTDLETAINLFKSGNYAVARIGIEAFDINGKKYLSTYLNAIGFAGYGDPIGGSGGVDYFGDVDVANVDPYAGQAAAF